MRDALVRTSIAREPHARARRDAPRDRYRPRVAAPAKARDIFLVRIANHRCADAVCARRVWPIANRWHLHRLAASRYHQDSHLGAR